MPLVRLRLCSHNENKKGVSPQTTQVTLPPNANGKLDVGGGVGAGLLYVVRAKMLPGDPGPSPYSSITEIRSGEVCSVVSCFFFLCFFYFYYVN